MDRLKLMKDAPRDQPPIEILIRGTGHALYDELNNRVEGYAGLNNMPLLMGKNKGDDKIRYAFMKHTSHLRLLSSHLKDGKFKTKHGHWEVWKFQLTHAGATIDEHVIDPIDTTLTWFTSTETGRCDPCSEKNPGKTGGWFKLPNCPYCQKKLWAPKQHKLTVAILYALKKNHPDGAVTDDNVGNYECRIHQLKGTKEQYKVEFLRWDEAEPDTSVINSLVQVEPVPNQDDDITERIQRFVDKAETKILNPAITSRTLMSASKCKTFFGRISDELGESLTDREIDELWVRRFDWLPYWPVPEQTR